MDNKSEWERNNEFLDFIEIKRDSNNNMYVKKGRKRIVNQKTYSMQL